MIEKLRKLAEGGEDVTIKLRHEETEGGFRVDVVAVSSLNEDPLAFSLTWKESDAGFPHGTLTVEPLAVTETITEEPPEE